MLLFFFALEAFKPTHHRSTQPPFNVSIFGVGIFPVGVWCLPADLSGVEVAEAEERRHQARQRSSSSGSVLRHGPTSCFYQPTHGTQIVNLYHHRILSTDSCCLLGGKLLNCISSSKYLGLNSAFETFFLKFPKSRCQSANTTLLPSPISVM